MNADDYSNSLLDDQLNIGYVQLATLLANLDEDYFEEQNARFNLVANSGLYSLPTDFMAFKGLRLAYSGTPLSPSAYVVARPYNPEDVHDIAGDEENIPVSNPMYDITGDYYRIKPKPTQAVTNGGRLSYIAMPSALASTGDVPIVPIAYHDKIAVYGAIQMAFKYQKWQKHDRLQADWNTTMAELEERIADRDRNRPMRFKTAFETGGISRPREL